MELDDLKNAWQGITKQENEHQNSNTLITEKMIKPKYYSRLKKITYSEITGVAICFAAAVFIGLNFNKLDTVFLQVVGIMSILLLFTLSLISVLSFRQFSKMGDADKPYADTLKEFAIQKIKFYKLQKLNVTLSYLLLVATIVLLSKFFSGRDLADNKYFWTFSFTIGYIFLLFYSKWVMKYYRNTLSQAENLLKELAS